MSENDRNAAGGGGADYAGRPEAFRHVVEVHEVTLSPEDGAALDRLLENGLGQAEVEAGDERGARVEGWLNVLGAHRVAQPPIDLMERTRLAAQEERMKLEPVASATPAGRGQGFGGTRRLLEYAAMAIAASVLVGVLIPGIGQARGTAKRVACANNLREVGQAFGGFASAHGYELPSLASPTGASWLPRDPAVATETEHSNTANVLPMLREKFLADPLRLACPAAGKVEAVPAGWTAEANDLPASLRGYSYVSMYGNEKPHWDGKKTTIVLADANPMFCGRGCKSVEENSRNHEGKGSMVLYADASARWETTPNVGPKGDNIWTVAGKMTVAYDGTEAPGSAADVFLAP